MIREGTGSAKAENQDNQPKAGDLVTGWDNASLQETQGILIGEIREDSAGTYGKIALPNGSTVEIFGPKKATPPTELEPTAAHATELESDSEALIAAWGNRAREMKRNQSSMLSDLLAHQKITPDEFDKKNNAWRNIETELEQFAKQLRNGKITEDDYRDLVENWLMERESSTEYLEKLGDQEPETPPATQPPTETESTTRRVAQNRTPEANPANSKEITVTIEIFRKEALKVKNFALDRLKKLLDSEKISPTEFEAAKQDWDNFDQSRSDAEEKFKNGQINSRKFTDQIITRGNELFSKIIALEARPLKQEADQTKSEKPSNPEIGVAAEKSLELPILSESEIEAGFKSLQVLGLDKEAEKLVAEGRSNQEIIDKLKIAKRSMAALIAKLNLPSARSGQEFEEWKASLNKPVSAEKTATILNPNPESIVSGAQEKNKISSDLQSLIERRYAEAEKLGIVEDIQKMAGAGLTIAEIEEELRSGTKIKRHVSFLGDLIHSVITKLEIPSEETKKWLGEIGDEEEPTNTPTQKEVRAVLGATEKKDPGVIPITEPPLAPENENSHALVNPESVPAETIPETPETPEQKLISARAYYAKLEYEKEKLGKSFSLDEEIELENARAEYFKARREAFEEKEKAYLEEFVNDPNIHITDKNVGKQNEALRKFSSIALASEFKEIYDAKTLAELEDKKSRSNAGIWLGRKWYEVASWYRNLPTRYKLAYSGALLATGYLAGMGVVAAGLATTGIAVQRAFSGSAGAIATEALLKKRQDKKFQAKFKERQKALSEEIEEAYQAVQDGDPAKGIVDFLIAHDNDLDNELNLSEKELRKTERWMAYRRYLAAGTVGAVIASGLVGKAIGKGVSLGKDAFRSIADHDFGDALQKTTSTVKETASKGIDLAEKGIDKIKGLVIPGAENHLEHTPSDSLIHSPSPDTLSHAPEVSPTPPDTTLHSPSSDKTISDFTKPSIEASAPETIEEVSKKISATIKPGENIWKAGRALVGEGKITAEQFNHAWANSTVELNGVKVPVHEVGLSHSGDQVIFVPDQTGGHFEIVDFADKYNLGTNQNLYDQYEKAGKEAPHWLKEAVHPASKHLVEDVSEIETSGYKAINPETANPEIDAQDVPSPKPSFEESAVKEEALSPDTAPSNETETPSQVEEALTPRELTAQDIAGKELPSEITLETESTLRNYCLLDQEELIKKTTKALAKNPNQPYLQKLLAYLEHHPLHESAIEKYNETWQSTGLTETEYEKVKNVKAGEFLKRYGRSLFEYFPSEKDVDIAEVGHRRSLANLIQQLMPSREVKNLTIEKILKMNSFGGR